jgi:hypothetical protein
MQRDDRKCSELSRILDFIAITLDCPDCPIRALAKETAAQVERGELRDISYNEIEEETWETGRHRMSR